MMVFRLRCQYKCLYKGLKTLKGRCEACKVRNGENVRFFGNRAKNLVNTFVYTLGGKKKSPGSDGERECRRRSDPRLFRSVLIMFAM